MVNVGVKTYSLNSFFSLPSRYALWLLSGCCFIGMLGFILLAYFSNQENNKIEAIIYIALALLFQPFVKVALGRTVWNIVDVIVSTTLIISLFVKTKKA